MANPEKEKVTASSETDETTGAPSGAPGTKAAETTDDAGVSAETQAQTQPGADAKATAETKGSEDASDAATSLEDEAEAIVDNAANEIQAESAAAAEAAEWKDKYIRLHAEWDTYRRRTKEQREEERARAAEKLVTSLIPIIDDLERTIDYAENNGETGLLSGVQAVLSKFVDTLQKDGVEIINPEGQAFNALEAQAVGTVEDTEQPDETVAQVYQKGYKMSSKVLRPAMVTVTTGGPKRQSEKSE